MALDLSLLVPLYLVAAVLLWGRAAWGPVLATIALVAGLLHQVSYLVAMLFQVAADVPGAVAFDPGEPFVVLLYAVPAVLLLRGLLRGETGWRELVRAGEDRGNPPVSAPRPARRYGAARPPRAAPGARSPARPPR
jgi:hypothetical protein